MRKATLKLDHVEIRVLLEAVARDRGRYERRGTPMAKMNVEALEGIEERLKRGFLQIERPKIRLYSPSQPKKLKHLA